jgi:DNA-binding response OmpR family regulator
VYRREELLKSVWGEEIFVAIRTVDVHMAKLRHKLRGKAGRPDIAETIWGVGYRLRVGSSRSARSD